MKTSRRTALHTIAAGAVGAAAAPPWLETLLARSQQHAHAGSAQAAMAAQEWTPRVLGPAQNEAVIVLTELVIPETDTPGAKGARVNRFIDLILHEAVAKERDGFLRGLAWMDTRSKQLYEKEFVKATPAEQTALLTRIAAAAPEVADREGAAFFRALKSMTIDGYYSSEIGLMKELGDPGQLFNATFVGCEHPEHQK
jgi:hypothetical protein